MRAKNRAHGTHEMPPEAIRRRWYLREREACRVSELEPVVTPLPNGRWPSVEAAKAHRQAQSPQVLKIARAHRAVAFQLYTRAECGWPSWKSPA